MRTIALALLVAIVAPGAYAQKPKPAPVRTPASAVLHFQIIEADGFETRDPQIRDVETALRSLFKFKGYRLAAEAMVRVTSWSPFQQVVYSDDDSTTFAIQGRTENISPRAGVSTSVSLFTQRAGQDVRALDTSVIVPMGQTVVVGTARPLPKRAALILVVRPTAN